MIIHLSPMVRADVVYGMSLAFRPWWGLRDNRLFCDPSKTDEERRRWPLPIVGSDSDGMTKSEELRFDAQSLRLESLTFSLVETNVRATWVEPYLRAADWPSGILARPVPDGFTLPPQPSRWYMEQADILYCMDLRGSTEEEVTLLRIADALALVCTGGTYRGWVLFDAASHLTRAGSPESPAEVRALLHAYLTLVAEPYIEPMWDGDPHLKAALLDLRGRTLAAGAGGASHDQLEVLRLATEDVLSYIYEWAVPDL